MKSIYNTNWLNVTRGLFYKNGVNLTAVIHQTHDCFSWKLGAGTKHIPLLIIIADLLAWTLHVALVKKFVSNELS